MISRIFLCLLLLFVLTPVTFSFAEDLSPSPSELVTISPVPLTLTPAAIEYTLPYPGILPNNPLYGLKTLRDNIVGWLIANPVKKATFDILQSDKRLESGVFLLNENKNNAPLAITTISKGENYMEDAIAKAQQANTEGKLTVDLVSHLRTATKKHREVLAQLVVPTSQKAGLQQLQLRVTNLVHIADKLSVKK